MHCRKKSFTLVEAILTVAIIGIMALVVLPRFGKEGFLEGLSLRSTASQVASDIRYTRSLAVANSGHYLVKFDFTRKEYKIYKDSVLPTNQVGETKKIPSDITCSGTDQFEFFALGNAIVMPPGLSISLGTAQYRIAAEQPTGAVVVEKIS